MVHRDELLRYLDRVLDPDRMADHGPNGLQVEGRDEVRSVVTGVTASMNLIEKAVAQDADALLVHHGVLWDRESARPVSGWHGRRLKALLVGGINLYAYHLPLDVHAEHGNNARLLHALGLRADGRFGANDIGFRAKLGAATPADRVVKRLRESLGADVTHIEGGRDEVRTVGVVTGAGQRYFEDAIDAGCDMFVTGEASEYVTHVAREAGAHYVWAGHHATEKGGVQSLGAHLAATFDVDVRFVDEENPV